MAIVIMSCAICSVLGGSVGFLSVPSAQWHLIRTSGRREK